MGSMPEQYQHPGRRPIALTYVLSIDTISVSHGDDDPLDEVPTRSSARRPRPAAAASGHEVHGARQGRGALPGARAARERLSRRCCRRQPPGAARQDRAAMILVDSGGWIEYLADRPLADRFAPY